jgi:probable O-glycosylation ligase (exosortase A-associated)
MHIEATAWWQPASAAPRATARASGSDIAFSALVAFTAILLLSPQNWFPVLKVLRIAFLAAGTAIGAHIMERTVRQRPATAFNPEIGIALTLVAWSIVTLPASVWPGGSVAVLTNHYLKAVAFCWLIGTLVTTTDRLRTLCWTLAICSIPLAATGVVNYLEGVFIPNPVAGVQRIYGYTSGLASNPNDLALMLNLIIPIAGALLLSTRRPATRLFALAVLLLCMTGVVVTFSRAGFLTLAAIVVAFFGVLVRRRTPGPAAAVLLIALAVPPLLPDGYLARLSTITDMQTDRTGSAQGRWRDSVVAAGVFVENPIIGAGIGQDILVLNKERGETWRRVHNAYLQYAVDLGLPGVLLFIWLHIMCFRSARAVEKRSIGVPELRELAILAAGVQVSLIAFGVAALFHPIAYQFYFFCIAGLAIALKNVYRTEAPRVGPVTQP